MTKINIEELALEYGEETASVGIIHDNNNYLRINIHDRDETMLTRVEIAVEDNKVILKTWVPERWEKNSPDHKFILGYL